jgi:electron transfer flavoprotein alpha subunit
MPGTLVLAEHLRGELREITLECISAAKQLEAPVTVGVIGREPAPLVAAANVDGVAEVVAVTAPVEEFAAEAYADAAEALIRERSP